jgi:PhzF family phenazine biosynthesis protein
MEKLFQVDAFTDTPFAGNPAGVCLLDEPRSDTWMMQIAREMNLSETAFLRELDGSYDLRWFTPKVEVRLCGHATLAVAHVLWEEKRKAENELIAFDTKSGRLTAHKRGNLIALDFPARKLESVEKNDGVNRALGIEPVFTGKYRAGSGDVLLLEVETDDTVRRLAPDFQALTSTGVRSVIVTARSADPIFDFVSRYFAPSVGVNEDPVTGSSHCILAPYWSEKLGKSELTAYQASERSGVVRCTWRDDRVILEGNAVTVFRIEIVV